VIGDDSGVVAVPCRHTDGRDQTSARLAGAAASADALDRLCIRNGPIPVVSPVALQPAIWGSWSRFARLELSVTTVAQALPID
jgi:hypothetical protein